jgi:hypothetical protein
MACCVLIMTFIAQLFALRRRVRRALGLPVGDWYDDEPQPSAFSVWSAKLRGRMRSGAARAVLATLVGAEITFAVVAAPGGQGLVAEHRVHARQAWEAVRAFGAHVDLSSLWCKTPAPALAGKDQAPQ